MKIDKNAPTGKTLIFASSL